MECVQDDVLGQLEDAEPGLKTLEEFRETAEKVQEESARILSRFEPTGRRPEVLNADRCTVVVDEPATSTSHWRSWPPGSGGCGTGR